MSPGGCDMPMQGLQRKFSYLTMRIRAYPKTLS